MANIFNTDFRDFLKSLNDSEVRYILVGGYAVVLHGYPRTTGDMDLWVERTLENYRHLQMAFAKFDLIQLKKAAGRSKDLNDIENLQ